MQSLMWLGLSGFLGVCTFFAATGANKPENGAEENQVSIEVSTDQSEDLNSPAAIRFRQQQARHWRHIMIKK